MPRETILRDLVASQPGNESKWFAAAKDAGFFELAIELTNRSPAYPRTLIRASWDFVVEWAGIAASQPEAFIKEKCGKNFHIEHDSLYQEQRGHLVLVKGGPGSRMLTHTHCISTEGIDRAGQPLKVLSDAAQDIF